MKIALAQQNYHIGNFNLNTRKILDAIDRAEAEGAELVVFSELCVCGYPPRDFLEFNDFIGQCYNTVGLIRKRAQRIGVIVGTPVRNPAKEGKDLFNAACLLYGGEILGTVHKTLLPTYDVFDEYRYFEPAFEWSVLPFKDKRIALTICEDLWNLSDNPLYRIAPMDHLIRQAPDLMINISASPFDYDHDDYRKEVLRANVLRYNLPVLYCNTAGSQTEIVFDGGSLVFNDRGDLVKELNYFEEDFAVIDIRNLYVAGTSTARGDTDSAPPSASDAATELSRNTAAASDAPEAAVPSGSEASATPSGGAPAEATSVKTAALLPQAETTLSIPSPGQPHFPDLQQLDKEMRVAKVSDPEKIISYLTDPRNIRQIAQALVLGIRDYFSKMGFEKAIIGSSGGIDSAVTLALACEALGAERVRAVLMPSHYSTAHSVNDAEQLSKNLGNPYDILPIKNIYDAFLRELEPLFRGQPFNIAEENIQSRTRGNLLMAIANKFGYILLNTSNKSELATGYGTLYGDMAGGLSVLGDVYKMQVYALAEYINRNGEIIPQHILVKPPSAELRPGQKDSDSLPEYPVLDKILYQYIERRQGPREIVNMGLDEAMVSRILRLVNIAEYKRNQFCPIIRVSSKAFGTGRRMPIVGKYLI